MVRKIRNAYLQRDLDECHNHSRISAQLNNKYEITKFNLFKLLYFPIFNISKCMATLSKSIDQRFATFLNLRFSNFTFSLIDCINIFIHYIEYVFCKFIF